MQFCIVQPTNEAYDMTNEQLTLYQICQPPINWSYKHHWKEHQLVIDINEITVPFPSRIRRQIKVELPPLCKSAFAIDGTGNHLWWPAAPSSAIEVDLKYPDLSWKGHAYLDSNRGIEPLEDYFLFGIGIET